MEFPEGSAAGSGGLGQVPARQRLGCPSGRERERKEVSADVRGAGAGARSTPTGRGSRGWRGGRGVVFPASPGIWTRIHLSAAGEGAGEEQPADQGCRPGQGTLLLLLLLLFGGCSEGAIFLPRTGLVPLPDPTARAAGASGCPRPSRPRVPFPWRGPEERVPSRRSVARCLRVKSQSCLLPPPQGSAEVPSACPETQGQPWEQPGPRHFGLAAPVCSEGGQV